MITVLSISALAITVLVYAVRASTVMHDSDEPRKRKRRISGAGVVVIAPVLILVSREPGADIRMLAVLLGVLVISFVMFVASFVRAPR